MDQTTMRQRVNDARVGRLATISPQGLPHIVPCCFVLSGAVIYSAVDAKPKSTLRPQRILNLQIAGSAALLVDHYTDDWAKLWWIRVDGTARVLEAISLDETGERDHALELLAGKYDQYVREPPPGPVIAIDIARWRAWP
jgi:PPOX class probable F420-dependent enzyme